MGVVALLLGLCIFIFIISITVNSDNKSKDDQIRWFDREKKSIDIQASEEFFLSNQPCPTGLEFIDGILPGCDEMRGGPE